MTDKLQIHEPTNLLQVINNLVQQPGKVDVEALHRLLDFQERLEKRNAEQQFSDSLTRLQAKLPQIDKHGQIRDNSGATRNKYAKYEDIDVVIRPMLAEEGFAVTFTEEEKTEKGIRYSSTLSHRAGHSVTKYITLGVDTSGSKNSIQAAGSSFSYARRYLLKAHLNLVEKGEDIDGNNDASLVSPEQVKEINTLIMDTKADRAKFLKLIAGVDEIEQIPARDYKRVINALEEKRRAQTK